MKNYCPIIFPYFFEKIQRAHFKITGYFLINFFFRFYSGLRKKMSLQNEPAETFTKKMSLKFFFPLGILPNNKMYKERVFGGFSGI